MKGWLLAILAHGLVACSVAAAAPALRVDRDHFTVDGTPRFLIFVSYFDGIRRARVGDPADDLAFLAGVADGIRVLPNWWASTCPLRSGTDTLIDLDGHIRADPWRALRRLLDAAASRGLLVDLSFTRETVTDNGAPARVLSIQAYERALVELVGSGEYLNGRYPNLLIDVQNEWERFADPPEIERLLAALHAADSRRVLAASVSGGSYISTGRNIPTMVAAYHDARNDDWHRRQTVTEQVARVRAVAPQPIYLQEPMPWGTVCPAQIHDENAADHHEALAAAKAAGAAAWTFHTRVTFDLSRQSLVEKLKGAEHAALGRALGVLRDAAAAEARWPVARNQ